MARKTVEVTIEDRGNPLHFVIEEMPATKLEAWIIRALLLVAGSGAEVPDGADLKKAGEFLSKKGLAALASIEYEKAEPLLNELLGCCYRKIDKIKERCTPETIDGYVSDVSTLFKLRVEAVKLNLGFLQAGVENQSGSRVKISIEGQ